MREMKGFESQDCQIDNTDSRALSRKHLGRSARSWVLATFVSGSVLAASDLLVLSMICF